MAQPSISPNGAALPHVPKWKKLGLKLKTVGNDDNNVIGDEGAINPNGLGTNGTLKRKNVQEETAWPSERAAKRSKDSAGSDDLVLNGITQLNKHIARSIPSKRIEAHRPPLQKRKSVTFAPEAKAEDGDSISQYRERMNAEHALAGEKQTSNLKPIKKKSNQKTSDSKTEATQRPALDQSHLEYLTLHHSSPDTWKFSKRHQNHILKHLFDLKEVPPTFDSLLISYFSGLQGFEARKRVRDQALQIRQEDEDWLNQSTADAPEQGRQSGSESSAMSTQNDPDRQRRSREAYEAEIARMRRYLRDKAYEHEDFIWEHGGEKDAWEERCKKRKRAEYILWSVGESEKKLKVKEEVKPSSPPQPNMSAQLQSQQQGRILAMGNANNSWMLGPDAARIQGPRTIGVPKKITFDEAGSSNGISFSAPSTAVNGQPGSVHGQQSRPNITSSIPENTVKKPRKRRQKRRTGVPDDDDTSSSSSDDDDQVAMAGSGKGLGVKAEDDTSDSEISESGSDESTDTEATSDESE